MTNDERELLIDVLVMTRMSDFAGTDVSIISDAATDILKKFTLRRTVQGDAGVEYRARATTGHVYGDVRITPEFAVAAYEEALDRETFEQDDETPVVETRRVGPWLPVEQGDAS